MRIRNRKKPKSSFRVVLFQCPWVTLSDLARQWIIIIKKSGCAAVRLKHEYFSCLVNSMQLTSLSRRLAGKLFQIRGPAAAKHLFPRPLWTREMLMTRHWKPRTRKLVHRLARKCSMSCSLLETGNRIIRYQITCQTRQKPMPVFCYRFLALISSKCMCHGHSTALISKEDLRERAELSEARWISSAR